MATKTKIAVFGFTGCEGCEFHLLSLDELLWDFFQEFEVTNWRLLAADEKRDFDVAFVEGAITRKEDIRLLEEIRETSKIVVALGACALTGNFFAEIPPEKRPEMAKKIYGENYQLKAKFVEPIEKYIKVDYKIPGCPPDIEKFKEVLALLGEKTVSSKVKEVVPNEYVTKIEGHGALKINFSQKKVDFEIEESERLVEELLVGKSYVQAPIINARICGICPVAHTLCSWKAIERALGIKIAYETTKLRELLAIGQMVKSHLLHLFFLVLPDFAGMTDSIELLKKYPAEFHLMLNLKRASEEILRVVGGSSAFPTTLGLGGFSKIPDKEELAALRDKIAEVMDEAEDLLKLFSGFEVPALAAVTKTVTTTPLEGGYPLYQGKMSQKIKEITKGNSPAKWGVLENGEAAKTGALARLGSYQECLGGKARSLWEKYPFDLDNPFNNNLAQALEITHFLETATEIIGELGAADLSLAGKKEFPLELDKERLEGEAAVEAPRGILVHRVTLSKEGKILDYNIIPPTQVNLASLKAEAEELIKSQDWDEEKAKLEIEKLIRAFDPCITCAVH